MKIYIMRSDTDNYDCLSLVYRNSGVLSDSPGFSPGIPVLNQKAITPSHIFFYQL
jgi:hypothetical protein